MRMTLQIRYNDYDAKGHINNAVYLTYFELGRMAAWRAAGGDVEANFILAEAQITYRAPAMVGVPLDLEVTTAEVRNKAWVWRYRVLDARDDTVIAEGTTTQVMYDYVGRRSVEIPTAMRTALMGI
jgi:acyl-CoA thioester hydrolase